MTDPFGSLRALRLSITPKFRSWRGAASDVLVGSITMSFLRPWPRARNFLPCIA